MTFADLLEQLSAYRDREYLSGEERDALRLNAIESTLQATLEKLRDMGNIKEHIKRIDGVDVAFIVHQNKQST